MRDERHYGRLERRAEKWVLVFGKKPRDNKGLRHLIRYTKGVRCCRRREKVDDRPLALRRERKQGRNWTVGDVLVERAFL